MARSPHRRIYYHCLWVQLTTTCSNATEVAQWADSEWSRPQPALDNGVIDGRSNWLAVTPTLDSAVPPERHLHGANPATNHERSQWDMIAWLWSTRPLHCLCSYSEINLTPQINKIHKFTPVLYTVNTCILPARFAIHINIYNTDETQAFKMYIQSCTEHCVHYRTNKKCYIHFMFTFDHKKIYLSLILNKINQLVLIKWNISQ